MTMIRLSEFLKTHPSIEKRKKMFIFSELIYKATSEKVLDGGFRYFDCDIGELVELFGRKDFAAIGELPFTLDSDGSPGTSGVVLDLAFTESGSMVAAQPVEYQNYNPTAVAEVLLLEGDEAKRAIESVKTLDQTRS